VRGSPPPRIALLSDGLEPDAWSGIPAGLARGLEAAGFDAVRVPIELPAPLRLPLHAAARARYGRPAVARRSAWEAAGRSVAVTARLRRLQPLAGVVAMTTELYRPPRGVQLSVLLDMTLAQAARSPASGLASVYLPAERVAEWIEREAETCRRARVCCVASKWAGDSLVADYGIDPDRVRVVGFGRNIEPEPPDRDWTRPRFLFVGRDFQRKGGDLVLQAFDRLHQEVPAATLDVVGGHGAVSAPGVTAHGTLRLADPADRRRLARLYATATCFVLPSRFEAFGIAYVEAAAAGIPSIGTTAGGGAHVLGEGARLVPPDDLEALLAAMRAFADPATAQAAGAAAQAATGDMTWEGVALRVLDALRCAPAAPVRARLASERA
jgi:glycosyltransferase involved in cell wall biosynthesis